MQANTRTNNRQKKLKMTDTTMPGAFKKIEKDITSKNQPGILQMGPI
jgi:hypothetical protein